MGKDGRVAVHARVYLEGRLTADHVDLAEVAEHLRRPGALAWIDLVEPTSEQLALLARELDLHELAVEDALKASQRPKLDTYENHLFVAARAVEVDPTTGTMAQTEVHAFLDGNWIVTVRSDDRFDLDPVVARVERSPHLLGLGASFVLYAVLDAVVDDYFAAVDVFDDFYDDMTEDLFEERPIAQDRQRQWFEMRRSLVHFHRTVAPLREVAASLTRRRVENLPEQLDPYFADVYDHVIRVLEATESLRELAASIIETNISLRDYRQNQIMKRVTSWAAIVAVPTLITGFYGMNVPYPGFARHWGVTASVVLMFGLSGWLYYQFKRRDWL
jgi:magnesium transporter